MNNICGFFSAPEWFSSFLSSSIDSSRNYSETTRKQHVKEFSPNFIALPYTTKREARYLIRKCYLEHLLHQQNRSLHKFSCLFLFYMLHNDLLGRNNMLEFFSN